ncbi:hypothetical protein VPNG_03794 [Cytospora leucostoma]|uniref:Uncharacterized protein n=1 Tax=Cytospora leucostoma TaxID=1230097 RepID=A0A423XF60_9PEZI|nr:hypothetical protein VPNG_03794 [Cytospora leucostoma]
MESDANSKRGRFMGKLFGKDRKGLSARDGQDLNNFLRGPSDTLTTAHAAPQMLAKLDTSNARRYPNALEVNAQPQPPSQPGLQASLSIRSRPVSQVRSRKDLVVRFADTIPEVIGDGGDECSVPTVEIGKRKRAQSAPPPPLHVNKVAQLQERERAYSDAQQDDFVPPPIRRTPTSFSVAESSPPAAAPIPTLDLDPVPPPPPPHSSQRGGIHDISVADIPAVPAGTPKASRFLNTSVLSNDDKRKSFIEINQAKQRQAEGMAFAQAVRRSASASSEHEWEETRQKLVGPGSPTDTRASAASSAGADSPESYPRKGTLQSSPASTNTHNSTSSPAFSQRWPSMREKPKLNESPTKTSATLPETPLAAMDDALSIFTSRTRHLFEPFRSHAEAVKPTLSCLPDDLARAALWWFLKGRTALEISIREQAQTPQQRGQVEASRRQAYADLAKAYWLFEEVLPEVMGTKSSPVDTEVQDVGQAITSQLRKLSSSMKRNGFLPPEDPMPSQAIDESVWVEYPAISQDVILLLWGSRGGALAQQRTVTGLPLLAALPLGDTSDMFCFGRYFVDVFLMEQGAESQPLHFPCFLSITRYTKQSTLEFCLASQDGSVQFRIQGNKATGPTWEDVKWRAEKSALEVKLPRGFALAVKCRPQDFKLLWGMQDFSTKALATLQPRKDEVVVFRSALRSFQYIDSNPQSTSFPRDPVRNCEVGLFEKIQQEYSPTGQRTYHRGFRLAVLTGPTTKMLSAVSHMYLPHIPVQFGFLRGEQSEPALLLRFDDGNTNGRMVMAFGDEPERLRFHSLLIGTAVEQDEKVYSEVPIVGYSIAQNARFEPIKGFSQFPWSRVKIINEDSEDEIPETVLAEKLKIVVDFKCGTITDRVNVAPGELKIRLSVKDKNSLSILRPPQRDMTIALSETQISKQTPDDMRKALNFTSRSHSVRALTFTSQRNLHEFEEALTGFKVLFDGTAAAFAISRRRMVVPIYKKWEATGSRLQVVQSENIIQVLVFFEDFHHGESMSFPLKPTDIFEAITRNKLVGIKIDDAKFPLPRMPENTDSEESADDGAFVSLDLPEIPGEHDDITILFESEEERDDLIRCLPAPVKGSRMSKNYGK